MHDEPLVRGLIDWTAMALSNRRIIGLTTAIVGVVISIAHFVFGLFDRVPEKYHGHEVIVGLGVGLAIVGLLLLGSRKQL